MVPEHHGFSCSSRKHQHGELVEADGVNRSVQPQDCRLRARSWSGFDLVIEALNRANDNHNFSELTRPATA
jgi:hypothetical protein